MRGGGGKQIGGVAQHKGSRQAFMSQVMTTTVWAHTEYNAVGFCLCVGLCGILDEDSVLQSSTKLRCLNKRHDLQKTRN